MAEHTREKVQAAISKLFAADIGGEILLKLDAYGTERHERERERVQLAILDLSKGDVARLEHYLDRAKRDYRDVLMWSEYARESSPGR